MHGHRQGLGASWRSGSRRGPRSHRRRTAAVLADRSGRVLRVACEDGATVRLTLPMTPRLVRADERVDAVRGCVAVERGPLVYCVEQADLPDGVAGRAAAAGAVGNHRRRAGLRTASGFACSALASATRHRTSTSPTTAAPSTRHSGHRHRRSRTRPGPTGAPVPCGSGSPLAWESPLAVQREESEVAMRTTRLVSAAAALALVLAGCGGGGSDQTSAATDKPTGTATLWVRDSAKGFINLLADAVQQDP